MIPTLRAPHAGLLQLESRFERKGKTMPMPPEMVEHAEEFKRVRDAIYAAFDNEKTSFGQQSLANVLLEVFDPESGYFQDYDINDFMNLFIRVVNNWRKEMAEIAAMPDSDAELRRSRFKLHTNPDKK
jgi:hypothetical protein